VSGLWSLGLTAALAAPEVNQPPPMEVVEHEEGVPVWKLGLTPAPEREAPTPTPPEVPRLPEPALATLSGGAEVALLHRPEIPLVRVEVSIAWPGLEQELRPRLAAALAGDLMGATRRRSAEAFASEMDLLGADWAVGMTRTRLWADVEVPAGSEEAAVALLAEALTAPRFRWLETRREARRWSEWRRDLWLDIRRSHDRAENHAWFPEDHPSRHTASPKDLKRLRARHLRRVARRVVREGQAFVAVAGATELEAMLPILEAHLGDLGGDVGRAAAPGFEVSGATWLVDRSGFDVAEISLMTPGPAWGDPDLAATQVLMGLLAGDFTSRVQTDLRETRGLTYGVGGAVQVWEHSGRLLIDLEVQEDRTAEAVAALEGQLDRLLAEGVEEDEVRRAKRALLLEAGQGVATNAQAAAALGGLWMHGEGVADLQGRLETIAGVTTEEVEAAAARWLGEGGRVRVITGDRDALEAALEEAGVAVDRVVTARALGEER
jgi:zinc protease